MKKLLRCMMGDSPTYTRWRYARKIRQLRRQSRIPHARMSPQAERDAARYWRTYGLRLNPAWHRAYMGVRPVPDAHRYIPEDIYYAYLEPALVRYELAEAYTDKNNYDRLFPDGTALPTVLRVMNHRCHDRDYGLMSWADAGAMLRRECGEFIIKPSIASGDGINVQKLRIDGGQIWIGDARTTLAELRQTYGGDFLIQPRFMQHPAIAQFHPTSVNTTRFMTLRLDDRIEVVSAVLRLGNCGRCVDNRGIPCGIRAGGQLTDHATTKFFEKHPVHPVTGMAFKGFAIPGWENACAAVRRLHARLPYFDLVSWDITIGPDSQPRMVELNLCHQEINFHQVNNGPLFGERTEQVLDRVLRRHGDVSPHPLPAVAPRSAALGAAA